MTIKRIGFACKWIDSPSQIDGIGPHDPARELSTKTTTVAWMNRQSTTVAYNKLQEIVDHNIRSIYLLVQRVGSLEPELRMVRLSSEVLPLYTESTYKQFYNNPEIQSWIATELRKVGELARSANVRVSFHPGQYTVLASDKPHVVDNSIADFEYHARMAEMMGYGRVFQDMKINVHISGKGGPDGVRAAYRRLSTAAQHCITIENEENNWGLDSALQLADLLPIVLDVHHHWIHEGEYIQPCDPRVQLVVDSWRGVRPVLHYSQSPETVLQDHAIDTAPNMTALLEQQHKRAKLRAHSDYFWNTAQNLHVLAFRDQFDIMCESKAKNLASIKLYEQTLPTHHKR